MTHQDVLGPVDTAFLLVETPQTPMNIGAITTFEGDIDFDAFVEVIDSRIHLAPLYQKRVIEPPLRVGQPYWALDPEFHISNHVFDRQLDAPGSEETLRDMIGHLISNPLSREKPLWEVYLIHGIDNGTKTGVFFKIHHCMVDGLAAVELFTLLMDFTPEPRENDPKPVYDVPYLPDKIGIARQAIEQDLSYKWQILNKVGNDLSRIGSMLADKEKRRGAFMGIANLLNDNLKPLKKLAINGKNTGKQSIAWADFSLAEVRAIRSNIRGSINDVMLTVLATALEKYESGYGDGKKKDLTRILIPVSMRLENEKGEYGNRISVLPIDVPMGISDPKERLNRTVQYTTIMKNSGLSYSLDMILTVPSLFPAMAQPLIWGTAPLAFSIIAHTWCTNVAGPQIPMYLLGHRMLSSRGFFPLNPSMGLACVVTSYNQQITMTLVADRGIVPDVSIIAKYLEQAFESLRKAAKVEPIAPINVEPVEIETSSSPTANTPTDSEDDKETTAQTNQVDEAVEEEKEDTSETNGDDTDSAENDNSETNTSSQAVSVDDDISKITANGHVPAQNTRKVTTKPTKPELFSEDWAHLYKAEINNSQAYFRASTRWRAGSLSFIIQADPRNGFNRPAAVWMDLHEGKCREAKSLTPTEARQRASFVIEGDYKSWMKVLRGEAMPLAMIMRRKLRLSKGSIAQLLPFTQSAQELVNSAQTIS